MNKSEFNTIIKKRWPELYWDTNVQYYQATSTGNIDTVSFMLFIKFTVDNTAGNLMYTGDGTYERTLNDIVEYIEEHEDMIEFWLL